VSGNLHPHLKTDCMSVSYTYLVQHTVRFSRPPPGRKTSDGSRGSAASERARAAEQREAAWSRRVAAASVASARKNKTNDILVGSFLQQFN
jgi:hypothetical protein